MRTMVCLVLIPLGQTRVHFPQSIQPFSIDTASWFIPLSSKRMAVRKPVLVKTPELQEATHEPHPMQVEISGTTFIISLKSELSETSRSIWELGVSIYPKLIITLYSYGDNYELPVQMPWLRSGFRE